MRLFFFSLLQKSSSFLRKTQENPELQLKHWGRDGICWLSDGLISASNGHYALKDFGLDDKFWRVIDKYSEKNSKMKEIQGQFQSFKIQIVLWTTYLIQIQEIILSQKFQIYSSDLVK